MATARYVDTDVSGGTGDGTSWANALSNADDYNALTLPDDDIIFYCRASSGSADAATLDLQDFPTGRTVTFQAEDGDQAVKTGWDATRYRLTEGVICRTAGPFILDGLQVYEGTAFQQAVTVYNGTDLTIKNCWVDGGTNVGGVRVNHASADVTVESSIFETSLFGTRCDNGIMDVRNCVITGADKGVDHNGGTATVTNCAVFDNTDDFEGSATINYCASDDGDGSNPVSPSGGSWANEFEDWSNGDYSLLSTGNLFEAGIAISGFLYDMDGDAWNDPPSLGVDEPTGGGYTLELGTGAVSITGQPIDITRGYRLELGTGSVSVTGQPIDILRARRLELGTGQVSITGQPIGFLRSRRLELGTGAVSITGQPIEISRGRRFELGTGSVSVTGQPIDINRSYRIELGTGAVSITGQPITIDASWIVAAIEQALYNVTLSQEKTEDVSVSQGLAESITLSQTIEEEVTLG